MQQCNDQRPPPSRHPPRHRLLAAELQLDASPGPCVVAPACLPAIRDAPTTSDDDKGKTGLSSFVDQQFKLPANRGAPDLTCLPTPEPNPQGLMQPSDLLAQLFYTS